MDVRRRIDGTAIALMVFVCICLGLQQVSIKLVADSIPPVFLIALRSGIGAVLVAIYIRLQRQSLFWKGGYWKPGTIAGALFALEYLLLGEALRFTSASHAVVFLYSAPVFASLILHFRVKDERLSPLQWLGTLVAFGGIAMAFLGRDVSAATPDAGLSATLLGDALALLAAVAWGMTTVVVRVSRLSTIPAAQTLLYQLIGAFLLLSLAALLTGQVTFEPTALALASLGFQSIVVSFVCCLIWFWLLRNYQASRIGTLSFMSPLFGVGFGAWLLAEPVERGFMAGAALVFGGIVLVNGASWIEGIWNRVSRHLRPAAVGEGGRS